MKAKRLLDFLLDCGWSVLLRDKVFCSSPGGAFRLRLEGGKIIEEELGGGGRWAEVHRTSREDRMVEHLQAVGWTTGRRKRGKLYPQGLSGVTAAEATP